MEFMCVTNYICIVLHDISKFIFLLFIFGMAFHSYFGFSNLKYEWNKLYYLLLFASINFVASQASSLVNENETFHRKPNIPLRILERNSQNGIQRAMLLVILFLEMIKLLRKENLGQYIWLAGYKHLNIKTIVPLLHTTSWDEGHDSN